MKKKYFERPKNRDLRVGLGGAALIGVGGLALGGAPLVAIPALAAGGVLVKKYYHPTKRIFDRNKRRSII